MIFFAEVANIANIAKIAALDEIAFYYYFLLMLMVFSASGINAEENEKKNSEA